MSSCLQCGTKLGCSCQKRVASDGRSVCANCLSAYEVKIKTISVQKPTRSTAPTNVNVFYKAPPNK